MLRWYPIQPLIDFLISAAYLINLTYKFGICDFLGSATAERTMGKLNRFLIPRLPILWIFVHG